MNYPFSAANHYRLIKGFFDSKQDFIVLGLCGKTGSGSTTVADILQKSFEQLNMPVPSDNSADRMADHEYRLLYTYTKVHWRPFYRIKTSALITARVLTDSEDAFLNFLDEFLQVNPRNRDYVKNTVQEFFSSEMSFDLEKLIQIDPEDKKYAWEWLQSDQYPVQKPVHQAKDSQQKTREDQKAKPIQFTLRTNTPTNTVDTASFSFEKLDCALTLQGSSLLPISFSYRADQNSATCSFKAKDLYDLFLEYQQRRQQKKGFDNPLLIFLLQEFIYDYLPTKCVQLWRVLAQRIPDVQVTALQQLGNNLRISGKPYGTTFFPDAYSTIAVDINTSIKLLNASLTWKKSFIRDTLQESATPKERDLLSLVVVDSIKNPFESMYLKARYTNYYLVGIYTEDLVRWERLRRHQGFSDTHIRSIDIVEQSKEFKRQYKQVLRLAEKFRKTVPCELEGMITGLMSDWEKVCRADTAELRKEWERFQNREKILPLDCHRLLKGIQSVLNNVMETVGNENLKPNWSEIYLQLRERITNMEVNIFGQDHLSPAVMDTIWTIYNYQLLDELPFILQNVGACLETADIFINNEPDSKQYLQLKRKMIRYVSLIMNPGLVLPSPVERCMQLAYTAKLNSGCISRQVGAVITDADYHLLSIGWNQQPEGQVPCSYRDLCSLYYHWSPEAYSDYECDDLDQIQKRIKDPVTKLLDTPDCPLILQGKLPAYCFKDIYNSIMGNENQVHPRSLHAEETAFLNLKQYSAQGGILFTTSSPCELCAKKAKYEGIAKIYYIEPYSGISLKHVLNIGSKESRPQMLLFTGAIGRAYMQLYTPLLPKKDELEFWLGAKVDVNLLEQIQNKSQQTKDESSTEKGGDYDA